jgi:hypothetical protein
MKELMSRLEIPIPDFVRNETFYVEQSAENIVTISSDLFVKNCIFVKFAEIFFNRNANSVTVKPSPHLEWNCSDLTEDGEIEIRLYLNANASIEMIKLTHQITLGKASSSQQEFEVVRKRYGFGNGIFREWLEIYQEGEEEEEKTEKKQRKKKKKVKVKKEEEEEQGTKKSKPNPVEVKDEKQLIVEIRNEDFF